MKRKHGLGGIGTSCAEMPWLVQVTLKVSMQGFILQITVTLTGLSEIPWQRGNDGSVVMTMSGRTEMSIAPVALCEILHRPVAAVCV